MWILNKTNPKASGQFQWAVTEPSSTQDLGALLQAASDDPACEGVAVLTPGAERVIVVTMRRRTDHEIRLREQRK